MPPTRVHFNGGVNLPDAETVFREIRTRVPVGVSRIPDGETGDRQNWIAFQLEKFRQTPGLQEAPPQDRNAAGYELRPRVRLADGATPQSIVWPNLGYADAYLASFAIFRRLKDEGVVPADVRFQVEYPTPLAAINAYLVPEDQDALEASYQQALLADLDRLLGAIPHDQLAVQWDVAVEFGILERAFGATPNQTFEPIVERLARLVDHIPGDVPVGLHLCYGDYRHRHFKEPESLQTQVSVVNRLNARARRSVSWFAFTVPQYQRSPEFFTPLHALRTVPGTELYFALVPYHPEEQEPGTPRSRSASSTSTSSTIRATAGSSGASAPSAAWPAPSARRSPVCSTSTGRSWPRSRLRNPLRRERSRGRRNRRVDNHAVLHCHSRVTRDHDRGD